MVRAAAFPPGREFAKDRRSGVESVSTQTNGMEADWNSERFGMNLETTRFGNVEIENDRVITFPSGLLGFSSYTKFVLLQPDEQGVFFWLQSVETPDLAFVVTDPALWVADFKANIRQEQMQELALEHLDHAQVFVIVNKRDDQLSANLQGPLVININERKAMQLVLADKRWTTRYELLKVSETAAKAASA
jgi:flagellar assembly factor FliW